jgi:multicomponent Na+:H+ antiporter subunit A
MDSMMPAMNFEWVASLGIDFSLAFTPSNLFFSGLVLLIGVGVYLYSFSYMAKYPKEKKVIFYSSLTLFTLAMLGIILTDHLLILFLFWEMTSFCSFFLIGFSHEKEEVQDKAKWALYTTVSGGLALLVGVVMLSQIALEHGSTLSQSFSLMHLSQMISLAQHPDFFLSFVFIFIGICSKSALFPFSFWLPLAMAGPTPVSSFLHSATMVKAGLFLAYKVFPLFGGEDFWQTSLIAIGSISALYAAFQCFLQRNLKTMLAYSTSCVLGLLTVILGLANEKAMTTFLVFVLAHAFYKAALFQLAGYLDKTYQTMDFFDLKELNLQYKPAFLAALLSTFSMVGLPLTMGFYAKEYIYLIGLTSPLALFLSFIFFISNLAMGIQAINFLRVFWPRNKNFDDSTALKRNHLFLLVLPALSFAILSFLLALFPKSLGLNESLTTILTSHLSEESLVKLKLWHGIDYPFNVVLILSTLTILGSFVGSFLISPHLKSLSAWSKSYHDFSLWPFMKRALSFLMNAFQNMMLNLEEGSLRKHVLFTICAFCFFVFLGLKDLSHWQLPDLQFSWLKLILLSGVLGGLLLALFSKIHYRILVYLAMSGLSLVFFFGLYSAADVSMTQLMVESLSLFFIFFLIKSVGLREVIKRKQVFNFFVALMFGATFLAFGFVQFPEFERIASQFFLENSYSLAKGENVVNVILVDFRAMDTFGEVIVVAIAIIGVASLLRKKVRK